MKIASLLFLMVSCLGACDSGQIGELYGSTYVSPDIIQSGDPSSFQFLNHKGSGSRQVFDRRVNQYLDMDMLLFQARFSDGPDMEVQVNPEFGSVANSQIQAEVYARAVGQLPLALRSKMRRIVIHRGSDLFGGGTDYLLVHTGMGEEYIRDGNLEETILHEAAHTSLDPDHKGKATWLHAQQTDGQFITSYARENPEREDVAESFVLYYAARHRADRIPPEIVEHIQQTMPNRIAYFDRLNIRPLSWTDITGGNGGAQ